MQIEKMDRSRLVIEKRENLDKKDIDYWKHAMIEEKLQTITYLSECFYGKEAATGHKTDAGRLQGICSILKLK
jgi:hypothetical protein